MSDIKNEPTPQDAKQVKQQQESDAGTDRSQKTEETLQISEQDEETFEKE